ncbi:hypothetical protein HDU78_010739, partial [Chytriomyces hyalinus]
HKIDALAPYNPEKPYHATFSDNCLEFRLDRRQTTYSLDDSDNIKSSTEGLWVWRFGQMLCIFRWSPNRADYFIQLLYFVRGFVCGYLLDLGYNTPAKILLAQLHPKAFFGRDLFSELYDSLAARTFVNIRQSTERIKQLFDFVAIDEIQQSLEGSHIFPLSVENRPFFSPLVFFSKHLGQFPKFIVCGTGINFDLLTELLISGSMKAEQFTAYDVISDLKPLDKGEAESYIRQMLSEHDIRKEKIDEVVDLVCPNPLFLGRGRFIAFILDSVLRGDTIDLAIGKFVGILSKPESSLFPLRFYLEDLQHERNSFLKVLEGEMFGSIVRRGLIQYLMTGKAKLLVKGQMGSDTVRYGLGFCDVSDGLIETVELKELAIVECLRHLVLVSELVPDICIQMATCPHPQMVGYVLEYLVGYALVAGLDKDKAKMLKSTHGNLARYLKSSEENQILFPDHCCGPDVVYKYQGTVYIVQVKFVDEITKQERLNACHTADPERFYWNKKSGSVMQAHLKKRKAILKELQMFTCKRIVFLHTSTIPTTGMEGVEIVNQDLRPDFFDADVWGMLNTLRRGFQERKSDRVLSEQE